MNYKIVLDAGHGGIDLVQKRVIKIRSNIDKHLYKSAFYLHKKKGR